MKNLLTVLICTALTAPGWGDTAVPSKRREDQIKAGYLFNFAKFVEWPPSMLSDALTICFVGADGIHRSLAAGLPDKRVGSRKLVVRSLRGTETPEGCNVLYVDAKFGPAIRTRIGSLQQPTLTVSDAKDFTRDGGMIALYTENNRLKFVVNVENVERVGLHISSNLLQLANSVEKGGGR